MATIELRKSRKFESDEYSYFIKLEMGDSFEALRLCMKGMPRYFLHAKDKTWEVPMLHKTTLFKGLQQAEIDYTKEEHLEENKAARLPKAFKYKTIPYLHQREGIRYGYTNNRWILGDDQGLGKTKQVIDLGVAKHLEEGFKHILIICGVATLKWNWREEVEKHSFKTSRVLGEKVRKNGTLVDDGTKSRLKDLESNLSELFLLTNIESLRDETLVNKLAKMCEDGTIGMVVLDEAHRVRAANARQSLGLFELKAKYMIAASGTILVTNPLNAFVSLKWLQFEHRNYYSFEKYYTIKNGFLTVGYKHMDELKLLLQAVMLRRLKTEVLDLPEKLPYRVDYVEMGASQRKLYNAVLKGLQEEVDKILLSPYPIANFVRLRQATSNPNLLTDSKVGNAKLERLKELVEDAVENDEKVIVYCMYEESLGVYHDVIKGMGYKPSLVSGKTPPSKRMGQMQRFQEEDECKVILGTIGALGTGFTLTAASTVIFVENAWDYATRTQAEDRAHRIGSTKPLTRIAIVCRNSVDEDIEDLVNTKEDITRVLIEKDFSSMNINRKMVVLKLLRMGE